MSLHLHRAHADEPGVERRAPSPRSSIVRWALLGTCIQVLAVLAHLQVAGGGNPVGLVSPGADGPSAAVFAADFPDLDLPRGTGHDGQQFYAVARSPFDLDALAPVLDRPRYRLQRPLYPWAAWLLHPTGGGLGLVFAFLAVGTVAAAGLGVALGTLSRRLGGGAWPALVGPLLPGVFSALRISTADTLALALTSAALALAVAGRHRWTVVAAVGAVLAKESSALILVPGLIGLVGLRRSVPAIGGAALVAVAWRVVVAVQVPGTGDDAHELVTPLRGLADAARLWREGHERWAAASMLATVVLAAVALRVARRHPLAPALVAQLVFLTVLHVDVIGLDLNATRMTAPAMVLSVVMLATPQRRWSPRAGDRPDSVRRRRSPVGRAGEPSLTPAR